MFKKFKSNNKTNKLKRIKNKVKIMINLLFSKQALAYNLKIIIKRKILTKTKSLSNL